MSYDNFKRMDWCKYSVIICMQMNVETEQASWNG